MSPATPAPTPLRPGPVEEAALGAIAATRALGAPFATTRPPSTPGWGSSRAA